jgi:hypothetical protein
MAELNRKRGALTLCGIGVVVAIALAWRVPYKPIPQIAILGAALCALDAVLVLANREWVGVVFVVLPVFTVLVAFFLWVGLALAQVSEIRAAGIVACWALSLCLLHRYCHLATAAA